jgi:RimK family alpha-L-glutamate ligase
LSSADWTCRGTLDGVEDGIWELRRVERRGIRVLNPAPSLIACHDKLQTALRLGRLGVPQPATAHVDGDTPPPRLDFPVVLKPRFGSWGHDVLLCESRRQLEQCLRRLRDRTWFRRQGVLVQALVPPAGFDLRLVVAGGRVVGAIERVAAPGEWRTNIALGGSRRPATATPEACALATDAAAAVEGDLVGVDLLPLTNGDYLMLEVNGAVEFTPTIPWADEMSSRRWQGLWTGNRARHWRYGVRRLNAGQRRSRPSGPRSVRSGARSAEPCTSPLGRRRGAPSAAPTTGSAPLHALPEVMPGETRAPLDELSTKQSSKRHIPADREWREPERRRGWNSNPRRP